MKGKLTFENITDALKTAFPEFDGYDHLKDNQSVYFSFFSLFVVDNFADDFLLQKTADFLNRMEESTDENLGPMLDDFFLNIYGESTEKGIDLKKFLLKLSFSANARYHNTVALWLRSNR